MYNFDKVKLAIPTYSSEIDDPKSAIEGAKGSCLAFAGNLGAQALVVAEKRPLLVRISRKKHISGAVTSHFMAVDPEKRIVCDMLASGPRIMDMRDLRKPYTDYQNARDRLLRVAIAAHLEEDKEPFAGEEIIKECPMGYESTIRVVRIELDGLLEATSPGTTAESLVTKLEKAVV